MLVLACVVDHNKKRVDGLKVGVPRIHADESARAQALKYAQQLMDNDCPFEHSRAENVREYPVANAAFIALVIDAFQVLMRFLLRRISYNAGPTSIFVCLVLVSTSRASPFCCI